VKLPFVILLTVLGHAGFVGSRVVVSLSAIDLGASPFTVGLLMSLYAALPMLIAVAAGRLVDRTGSLKPLRISIGVVAAGILLPSLWPGFTGLYVTAVIVGTAFTVQHIALNHVVGNMGTPADRPVNFSWFALGFAMSGFIGPLAAGFAIDLAGHRIAFALLAAFPAAAFALLFLRRVSSGVKPADRSVAGERNLADLLRHRGLRTLFLFSGLLAMGWDLYTFVMPIYGSRIGLSASTIGIVMASFAAATFVVRLAMPSLAPRLAAWAVVMAALLVSGTAYSLFPLFHQVPMLMALSFLLGLGLGCAQPMMMSLLYASSPPGRQGEVVGVRTTMLNASHTFLPLLFGALGAAVGMSPVFWTMAALLLSGGWLANRQHRAVR
jgi:predicted MFS family arabinose efflux permease